jgi:hypothetical protein
MEMRRSGRARAVEVSLPRDYERWNDALAERFFPAGNAGQSVYLDPDGTSLTQVGQALGVSGDPIEHFVASVVDTLIVDRPRGFLRRHTIWLQEWARGDQSLTPPFVAVLSLFSYASTFMPDDRAYFPSLCKVLGITDKDGLHHGYNKRVRHYWVALNSWIERTGRGTPTAYPQDWRANVSLLLTQRFLSAAERAQLPVFFAHTRLAPGTSMTISEMEAHVRAHLHHLPRELHGEWARHPTRFAEVAAIELESWTGRRQLEEGESPQAPLLLGTYFDSRRGMVDFPLAITGEAVPGGEFFVEGAGHESALIAALIEEVGGRVVFDTAGSTRFAQGGRLSAQSIGLLLEEGVSLVNERKFTLAREPSVIVLLLPLSPRSYLEAPGRRAPLGSRFSVLVPGEVDKDPGFRQIAGEATAIKEGMPPGWVLYQDVELTDVPEIPAASDFARELRSFVPIKEEATIDLRGGIALAGPTRSGRAWLAARPPQIVVSSARAGLSVELHVHPSDGTASSEEELVPAGDRVFARRAPGGEALPPGDHQVFAAADGNVLAQRKLRLVASDTPRVATATLGYSLSGESAWRALSAEPDAGEGSIRGAAWNGLTPVTPPLASAPPVSLGRILDTEDKGSGAGSRSRAADIRPDKHRRARRKRRAKLTRVPTGGILVNYLGQIQDAIEREEDGFTSPDGHAWTIKYCDGGNFVVRPADALVPLANFSAEYTRRAAPRSRR